jgi:hypothetical protein
MILCVAADTLVRADRSDPTRSNALEILRNKLSSAHFPITIAAIGSSMIFPRLRPTPNA